VEHHGDSARAGFLQLTHGTNKPGTVTPTAEAKRIVFDDQPVKQAPSGKQGGKLSDRLGVIRLEEWGYLDTFAGHTLAAHRSPDAHLDVILGKRLGEPKGVVPDTIKVRREGSTD
jgi:hypothetical protein